MTDISIPNFQQQSNPKSKHGNEDHPNVHHGQLRIGADRAFFWLTREHPVRKLCIRLAMSKALDAFVILAIISNSIILGLVDFSVVDSELNPVPWNGFKYENGKLVPRNSIRNSIVYYSEVPFTSIFATECLIKIIALGLVDGKGTYLRDSWNVMDFVVVVSSLVGIIPGVPNVSAIRTIRVLRSLRSMSVVPGMRKLISALLQALPALGNVLVLQLFVFAIAGILGTQLFGGNMGRRCRITEFPVKLPIDNVTGASVWPVSDDYLRQVVDYPHDHKCLDTQVLDDGDPDVLIFRKETSPWNTPRDCFWPIDENDTRLCSALSVPGKHLCRSGRTCGSNYDTYGNPRFTNSRVMDSALYSLDFNWGYTTFDNIGLAFFTIFQSITQEGWTGIMYMVMDMSDPTIGAMFFLVLMVFAGFFLMNLTLAVISDEFNVDDEADGTENEEENDAENVQMDEQERQRVKRPWLFMIVSSQYFGAFIMTAIFLNTVVLSLDHYPMPGKLEEDLEIANFVLSVIFFLEMLLKLTGLGLRLYARDKYNIFDAFIVTVSVLETSFSPPSFMSSNDARQGIVSALRSFRLFRVFKLARSWRSLRELLGMIMRAVASITNFAILLFLFIYIYALVGLQFFANTMRFDQDGYPLLATDPKFWEGEVPRNNFDSVLWAVITVFQVITGENWNNIMYDVIRGNGRLSSLYFISLVVMGNFILMNLFLALLLDNISTVKAEDPPQKEEDAKQPVRRVPTTSKVVPMGINNSAGALQSDRKSPPIDIQTSADTMVNPSHLENGETQELPLNDTESGDGNAVCSAFTSEKIMDGSGEVCSDQNDQGERSTNASRTPIDDSALPNSDNSDDPTLPPAGRALFLFPETNRYRQMAYALTCHPWFDSLILALIMLSSISLALDNPLANPSDALPRILGTLDTVFAIVFLLEMLIKVFALGAFTFKGSYLRNSWNILDFIIVVSSLAMIIGANGSGNLKSLRSLRGLRTFRPLRMISRRPGLKLVVNALFEAIPAVMNVLFVCTLFYLIFSIVAVNYLKGKFYSCSGPKFDDLSSEQLAFLVDPQPWSSLNSTEKNWFTDKSCDGFTNFTGDRIYSKDICLCWGAEWAPVIAENFDNVARAMLTLFEISSTEGWADVMMAAIDATEIDMQPIRDNNYVWAYFFVAFMMVGCFLVVNLIVGVIIDNFNNMKIKLGGDTLLTEEQKKWIEAQKTASRCGPIRKLKRPKHWIRGPIFDVVKHDRFEWFIMGCIIVNTILMATQYYGQPTTMIHIVDNINEVFAVIFTLEAALKIIAYHNDYFVDTWNRFDFFVVLGTLGSIVIEFYLEATSIRSLTMLVRVFRVTRIIRLVKASKSVRQILLTLYLSLPGLSNITSILFLMMFIYATWGIQMFAKVAFQGCVDIHANFQDFFTAFLFLLRAATGEAWNTCMHNFADSVDGCVSDPPYDPNMCGFSDAEDCVALNGCGNPIAYIYFCSFTFVVTYAMLNLTIAVILEGFSRSHEDEEPLYEPELLEEFQNKWADVDIKATGFLHVRQLRLIITILEAPLGCKAVLSNKCDLIRYVCNLRLPMYEGETIYFRDVLLAMTREMVKQTVTGDLGPISTMSTPNEDEPNRPLLEFQVHDYFAACFLQRRVVQWLHTKRQLEKQYMEEYKNKIKKPSGRPKKVRDARVYTIG